MSLYSFYTPWKHWKTSDIKKKPQRRCFPVNIAKYLRTPMFSCEYCEIFKNTYFEKCLQMLLLITVTRNDLRLFVFVNLPCREYKKPTSGIYLFKANNGKTKTNWGICSKSAIKRLERFHWCCSGVFIVNFK